MESKIKQSLLLRYVVVMLLLATTLCFIHNYISINYIEEEAFNPILGVYVFLVCLSLVATGFVGFGHYISESFTGYAFIVGVVLKMFASLVFLFPLLKSDLENKVVDVVNFFIPFFIFLFLEVWFCVQILASKKMN